MKVFIKKTEFGFQYQTEGNKGFNYFNNGINTREDMLRFFKQRFDTTELIFVNKEGKPVKYYTIKKGETLLGHPFAMVDYEKQFLIEPDMFVTDAEKLDFLQNHSSMKMDIEAGKLTTDQEKIKYYLNVIPDETKEIYKTFLNEKLSPDVLRELCENNAKTYSLPAEVEFISE
jgi:hypothetical protein